MTALELHPAMCGATWLVLVSTINSIFLSLVVIPLGAAAGLALSVVVAMGWWRQGASVTQEIHSFSDHTLPSSPDTRRAALQQRPAP